MIIRRLLILAFFLLAILCPRFTVEKFNHDNSHINIWFAVDSSSSTDKIAEVVEKVPGAKYGMIVQDYSVYDAVPLTYNKDAILSARFGLVPNNEEKDLNKLLSYTKERASSYYDKDSTNVIILITDKNVDFVEKDIDAALRTINNSTVKSTESTELYFIFAFIVLILLLWEGEDLLFKILREKENQDA